MLTMLFRNGDSFWRNALFSQINITFYTSYVISISVSIVFVLVNMWLEVIANNLSISKLMNLVYAVEI